MVRKMQKLDKKGGGMMLSNVKVWILILAICCVGIVGRVCPKEMIAIELLVCNLVCVATNLALFFSKGEKKLSRNNFKRGVCLSLFAALLSIEMVWMGDSFLHDILASNGLLAYAIFGASIGTIVLIPSVLIPMLFQGESTGLRRMGKGVAFFVIDAVFWKLMCILFPWRAIMEVNGIFLLSRAINASQRSVDGLFSFHLIGFIHLLVLVYFYHRKEKEAVSEGETSVLRKTA